MSDLRREMVVDATLADLPLVFEFVSSACEEARVRQDARFDLQLAVEEACANVIEHAYGAQGGSFSITFATRGADVILTVVDHGPPFDPGSVAAPDLDVPLEDRRIGGLGVHLMKTLMDEVHYAFTEHGNVVKMVRRDVVGGPSDA